MYRLRTTGQLDLPIDTVPSPNGIVLNLTENQIYIAVTRANAIWRLPIMADGGISKAGTWIQVSGGLAGPDGLALDAEGGLLVAHLGIGIVRFDRLGRPTHLIGLDEHSYATNLAFGGARHTCIFVTESATGAILRAELPIPGRPMYSHA